MATYLQDLKAQLKSCMDDLAAMPKCKVNTEWHLDRVDEARFLTRQIDRLEGRKPLDN